MKLNPSLVFRKEFDQSGLLFNPDDGRIFTLNPTTAFICEKLQEETTKEAILAAMQARIRNVPAEAEADLEEFLGQLRKAGFLMES